MNFLKEIESLDINNKLDLKSYIYALEDRLSSINDMKPKSNSELYNKWLNRYNDLDDIVKITKEIKDEKKLKIVKKRLQEYQEEYGGLLRYNLVFKDNYKYEDRLLYDFFIVTSVFKYYCIINFNLFSKYMDRHIKNANIKDYPSYISSIFFSRIGLGPYVNYTADKYIFEWINKIIYLAKYQTDTLLNTNITDLFYYELYNKVYEVKSNVRSFETTCTNRYNSAYSEAFALRKAKDAIVETELPIHEYAKVAAISKDKNLAMSYAIVDASIRSKQEYRKYQYNENEFKNYLSKEIYYINEYWNENYNFIKENIYNLFMKKIDNVLEQFLFFQVNNYSKALNKLNLHNDSFDYTPYLNEVGDIIGKKVIPINEAKNNIYDDCQKLLKKYEEDRKNIKFIHHFIKRKQVINIINGVNILNKYLKSFVPFDKYIELKTDKICSGYDSNKNDDFIYCKYNKVTNIYEIFYFDNNEKIAILDKKANDLIGINHKLLGFYSPYLNKREKRELLLTFTTDITDIDDLNEYYQDLARLK